MKMWPEASRRAEAWGRNEIRRRLYGMILDTSLCQTTCGIFWSASCNIGSPPCDIWHVMTQFVFEWRLTYCKPLPLIWGRSGGWGMAQLYLSSSKPGYTTRACVAAYMSTWRQYDLVNHTNEGQCFSLYSCLFPDLNTQITWEQGK
jgi:hypothetical protein